MTIAERLEFEGTDSLEDVIAAGGIEVPTDKSDEEYVFPDGSKCWRSKCCGIYFDWGMGCCLPE